MCSAVPASVMTTRPRQVSQVAGREDMCMKTFDRTLTSKPCMMVHQKGQFIRTAPHACMHGSLSYVLLPKLPPSGRQHGLVGKAWQELPSKALVVPCFLAKKKCARTVSPRALNTRPARRITSEEGGFIAKATSEHLRQGRGITTKTHKQASAMQHGGLPSDEGEALAQRH